MSRRLLVLVALAWLWPSVGARSADPELVAGAPPEVAGTALDFTLRCRGCHGLDGEGTPGHVPRLDGFVGWFTHLPDGRDYLMRVPGVARTRLSDERLAAVLNWMLETYGGDAVAPGFAPFTAAEVGEARRRPIVERTAYRARLIAEMRERGLIGPEEDGFGVSPERRAGAPAP